MRMAKAIRVRGCSMCGLWYVVECERVRFTQRVGLCLASEYIRFRGVGVAIHYYFGV